METPWPGSVEILVGGELDGDKPYITCQPGERGNVLQLTNSCGEIVLLRGNWFTIA